MSEISPDQMHQWAHPTLYDILKRIERAVSPAPRRWEYAIYECTHPIIIDLDDHGKQGWELVTIYVRTDDTVYAVFKREVQ
jgi:hypothetical protein